MIFTVVNYMFIYILNIFGKWVIVVILSVLTQICIFVTTLAKLGDFFGSVNIHLQYL